MRGRAPKAPPTGRARAEGRPTLDIAPRKPPPVAAPALVPDPGYLTAMLRELLRIPSPVGYTDNVVHFVGEELDRIGVPFEITRRGAIRADLKGKQSSPDRAVVSHLDTLGAMVKWLKESGRLAVVPIGTWSARFAEGARVTVFCDDRSYRGTILPLKASGHVFHQEVDSQPVGWDNLEIRIDERVGSLRDLIDLGFNVGDFVAIDPSPEFLDNGFINARHLDDKAGVAAVLAAVKAVVESGHPLEVDCHVIFTIAEEVGVGVPGSLHGDVAEMVTIDNGTIAPGQNTCEYGVTIAVQDSSGPFDYHLVRKLIRLCQDKEIPYSRDVFADYRSDSASALAAGIDLRTALICFALDASHGYERTHAASLDALARLVAHYIVSPPTFQRDKEELGSIEDFSTQPD